MKTATMPIRIVSMMGVVLIEYAILLCSLEGQDIPLIPGAAPPPIVGHVTIEARGFEPTKADLQGPGPHNSSFAGHIFIEVVLNTDSGPKSSTYGFYPDPNYGLGIKNQNFGMIRGPGLLKSETRCDSCTTESVAKHFGAIQDSVQIDISILQKQALFKTIDQWNMKDYQLVDNNCVAFVDSAVKALGYPTPVTGPIVTPVSYMKALKETVTAEKHKREEVLAKQEKIKDALRSGWVVCTCPSQHHSDGIVIDGVRYHPANLVCPQ